MLYFMCLSCFLGTVSAFSEEDRCPCFIMENISIAATNSPVDKLAITPPMATGTVTFYGNINCQPQSNVVHPLEESDFYEFSRRPQ